MHLDLITHIDNDGMRMSWFNSDPVVCTADLESRHLVIREEEGQPTRI